MPLFVSRANDEPRDNVWGDGVVTEDAHSNLFMCMPSSGYNSFMRARG